LVGVHPNIGQQTGPATGDGLGRRGLGHRFGYDRFGYTLGAPTRAALPLGGLALGCLEGGERRNELFRARHVKIHNGAIVAQLYNRSVSVLGMSNVLSGFESHRVPFC